MGVGRARREGDRAGRCVRRDTECRQDDVQAARRRRSIERIVKTTNVARIQPIESELRRPAIDESMTPIPPGDGMTVAADSENEWT